jgi:hypothetical protein
MITPAVQIAVIPGWGSDGYSGYPQCGHGRSAPAQVIATMPRAIHAVNAAIREFGAEISNERSQG